jgi:hypothetical protein
LRYLHVPQKPADFASRAAVKFLCPAIPKQFLFKESDDHELVLRPDSEQSKSAPATAELAGASA